MTPHPAIPDGSCDCHVHIYDPAQSVAADGSGRVMPEATLDAYYEVQARLGLQRAVIVQPNAYGTDNTTTLAAVAALGANARGVAIVTPATSEEELARLHMLVASACGTTGWTCRRRLRPRVRVAIGTALLAAALLVLMAAPGLVSDRDSTVPLHLAREARR